MGNDILIECVIGQNIQEHKVPKGSSIRDVLGADAKHVGVFGKIKSLDYVLQTGDRIEVYRPLLIDPKDARRARAKKNNQ